MGAQESSLGGGPQGSRAAWFPEEWKSVLKSLRISTLKEAVETVRNESSAGSELVFCTKDYFVQSVLGLSISTGGTGQALGGAGGESQQHNKPPALHNLGKVGSLVNFCVLDLDNTEADEEAEQDSPGPSVLRTLGASAHEIKSVLLTSNVFIFQITSPGQDEDATAGSKQKALGPLVLRNKNGGKLSKKGNIAVLHDCGYQKYSDRLQFVQGVSDLSFDTQSAYDKVQRALAYLREPGSLRGSNSPIKKALVDLETPLLRPMNPGDDFLLTDGRVFIVVYSKKQPTYYDLSLAGATSKLNLTYCKTRFEGSLAFGSGDQVGAEYVNGVKRCDMLVHEFQFRPEELRGPQAQSENTGCVLFSGYNRTKLKAWSEDRPIVMLMHVDANGVNTLYYCPAPMNERIGNSVTYGAISFQVFTPAMLAAQRSSIASRWAGQGGTAQAAASSSWKSKIRFYLHTAQEGYCPAHIDQSAPVKAECYKHYYDLAKSYFASAPSLEEIEGRNAVAADEQGADDADASGQEATALAAGAQGQMTGALASSAKSSASGTTVEEKSAAPSVAIEDPFANSPGPVIVSNSKTASSILQALIGLGSASAATSPAHGNDNKLDSSQYLSLLNTASFIEFTNGFRRWKMKEQDESTSTSVKISSPRTKKQPTKAFLGQVSSAKQTRQPALLMMGKVDENLMRWCPSKNPTLLFLDDTNRIPYEVMGFVDGPRKAFEECLCVIYTSVKVPEDLHNQGAIKVSPEAIESAFGQIDMNPLMLLGQKSVVLAVVVNENKKREILAARVLRKGPSGCGSTLIDDAFADVTEAVTFLNVGNSQHKDSQKKKDGSKEKSLTVSELLERIRNWAFAKVFPSSNEFQDASQNIAHQNQSAQHPERAFVDCAGKILVPPGKYVGISEFAAFVKKEMFIPELFHSFASEIEARLNDLTTNFHEENRINDAAAGISDLQLQNADEPEFDAATGRSKEDAQNTLATQRKRELLSKCHAAFETELSKRLEKNIGETLKLLLSHLEWVANEAQISTVRGQLMQAWSDEVAPKLLQLHERLVLSASKSAGAALAGSSPGALSNASALSIHTAVSTDLSSDVKMGNAAVALVPTTSLEKTASTPAEALALAWQTNDLDSLRAARQLKNMVASVKRKCDYLARFFDLSSKRKPNATYAMIVDIAAKNKRGVRAQQKADTTKANLSTLHNMDRDDFLSYYSQPEVCQTILHAVIDTVNMREFENQVVAICGPEQDFLRLKPDAKLLKAVEERMAEREQEQERKKAEDARKRAAMSSRSTTTSAPQMLDNVTTPPGPGEMVIATGASSSSSVVQKRAAAGVASTSDEEDNNSAMQKRRKVEIDPTSITPSICGVSDRIMTVEPEVYSEILSVDMATEGIAVNDQVSSTSGDNQKKKEEKTTLCYRPTMNTAPMIPIPIFSRYALKEQGEAEEIFMGKSVYIPWDEETAKPDVQMWRMAVSKVIQNSSTLQRAVTMHTGGGAGGSLTIPNAQWVIVKILLDLALIMTDRAKNLPAITEENRFDTLPSMIRSLVLTAVGITQAGDKPLGNAWAVCKNVNTRPELPEDKRDWFMLLVLAKVYPKTGMDAKCFRANLRKLLVRFFNKICEPYIQELHKDYEARKKQYDKKVADNYILQPISRKELAPVMVNKPSRFCAICWLLKPAYQFPKNSCATRRVDRGEKHRPQGGGENSPYTNWTSTEWNPPQTLEEFKTSYDTRMQMPKADKKTGATAPYGKTLSELYHSSDFTKNQTGFERKTNEALRAVIFSFKANKHYTASVAASTSKKSKKYKKNNGSKNQDDKSSQGGSEKGRITEELEKHPDFETFCARVRHEVCATTGHTCVMCRVRLNQIGKTQVNVGGFIKTPKDANYVVPLPDAIEPLPGIAMQVIENHNAEVERMTQERGQQVEQQVVGMKKEVLEQVSWSTNDVPPMDEQEKSKSTQGRKAQEKKDRFLGVCGKAFGAKLVKEEGVFREYQKAKKEATEAYQNNIGEVQDVGDEDDPLPPWLAPKKLLVVRGGASGSIQDGPSMAALTYGGGQASSSSSGPQQTTSTALASSSKKRQRDDVDDLETVPASSALLANVFDGEKATTGSAKKRSKASTSAQEASSLSLNKLQSLFAAKEAEFEKEEQSVSVRFASLWASTLVGNEMEAIAAVCATYRGPDFDVLVGLVRAAGLVLGVVSAAVGNEDNEDDAVLAIQSILRGLVLDFRCKDAVERENNFLEKFYSAKGNK